MELLLSLSITILAEGFKKLIKKVGETKAKFLVLGFVLLLSVIYSVLNFNGFVTAVVLKKIVTIFGMSIASYEIVFKKIIYPVLNKIKK